MVLAQRLHNACRIPAYGFEGCCLGRNALFSKAVQSTNGSHAAHNNASLINTIPVISNKHFQTLGERPAHAIHIVIVVDLLADSTEPACELLAGLFQRVLWQCDLLTVPDP